MLKSIKHNVCYDHQRRNHSRWKSCVSWLVTNVNHVPQLPSRLNHTPLGRLVWLMKPSPRTGLRNHRSSVVSNSRVGLRPLNLWIGCPQSPSPIPSFQLLGIATGQAQPSGYGFYVSESPLAYQSIREGPSRLWRWHSASYLPFTRTGKKAFPHSLFFSVHEDPHVLNRKV